MRPIPALTESDLARFWSKVNKNGECWLWTGRLHTGGYGLICFRDKDYRAHRVSYTIANNDPGRLNVNHTCDMPSCVNPAHLWKGTQQEGMNDKVAKNRQDKGESHGLHILTEEQVGAILASKESHQILANRYGMALSTISGIKHGKSWKHIKGPRHVGLRSNNKTGVPGVTVQNGQYRARFWRNKKSYSLGFFDSIKGAAQAITKKKLELSCETG